MEKRKCNKCNQDKPLKDYAQKTKGRLFWTCRECRTRTNFPYTKKYQLLTLKCPVCQKPFTQSNHNQRRCSIQCTKKFQSFEWQIKNIDKLKGGWLKLRFEIFKRDNFTCQYCGRNVKEDKIKIHCDHIIPRSKGGKNILENLTTACEECNLGKKDFLLTKKRILLKTIDKPSWLM